uniref:Ribosomal protein L29 n=1 Tax=Periphykon beckeri TaxID=2006982 RepID=A0A1Z1M301_9FLOR|nr:ribosomal protein L29 [Periphykon beckeri]ARW60449.1 ribosomal protein L29 [Periphykon beckeri]
MNIKEETIKLKKDLAILRMNRITQQKNERHKIKQIQHKISQILNISYNKNN